MRSQCLLLAAAMLLALAGCPDSDDDPVLMDDDDASADDDDASADDDDADDDDDTDPAAFPGNPELLDAVDNDCDGTVDDGTWTGDGSDGPLTITGLFDLSADATGPRVEPDGVSFPVTAISGAEVTVAGPPDGIEAGDEVLVINLHGSDAAHGSVGSFEFAGVLAVGGDVLSLTSLSTTFGELDNGDLGGQSIVLQRVPHYTDVTVQPGGVITAAPWDGQRGGVLALRANGTLLVEAGGAITTDQLGYPGGATGSANNCDAYQGGSYAGEGDGDGPGLPSCWAAYNEATGQWAPNHGGGGAHITGAGGNHGGGAEDGDSWTGGSATPPMAGLPYGEPALAQLFCGSGGGGVWNGGVDDPLEDPGPGGDGGGILFLAAATLQADDAGAITALGGTTLHWAHGAWTYGAGGGAGGSIWLIADDATLATGAVDAGGGFGQDDFERAGGDGGVGRVRIDCDVCGGFDQGTPDATAALQAASEPDPGWSEPTPD